MDTKHKLPTAALAVVAVVASGLTALTPAAAAESRGPGYRIPATGTADGGWIGSYRVKKSPALYRIQPRKRGLRTGYRKGHAVRNLNGRKLPSRRATQRAAYVLSVYGDRGDAVQRAAVDAATYHLLRGGKWRIGRSRGAQRIRQSGPNRATVRSFAREFLARSGDLAGPYRIAMSTSPTTEGGNTKATVRVRSRRTGKPLANRPVAFSYRGSTQQTYTNSSGLASAVFAGVPGGTSTVTATVSDVPMASLIVRNPRKKKASKVAVSGRKTRLSAVATVKATGAQGVSIQNASSVVRVGQVLGGTYSIWGGSGTRAVTRRVHGPFPTTAASCGSTTAATSTTSTSAPGTWSLPTYTLARSGYYRWAVVAGSNELTSAASACGAVVRVQKQAAASQYRPAGQTKKVQTGKRFAVGASVSGFDRAEGHHVTSRLYGPFAKEENVACTSGKEKTGKRQTRNITTNGSYDMPKVVINSSNEVGYYVWQTTLSSGDLILGGTSSCGVVFNIVP